MRRGQAQIQGESGLRVVEGLEVGKPRLRGISCEGFHGHRGGGRLRAGANRRRAVYGIWYYTCCGEERKEDRIYTSQESGRSKAEHEPRWVRGLIRNFWR